MDPTILADGEYIIDVSLAGPGANYQMVVNGETEIEVPYYRTPTDDNDERTNSYDTAAREAVLTVSGLDRDEVPAREIQYVGTGENSASRYLFVL